MVGRQFFRDQAYSDSVLRVAATLRAGVEQNLLVTYAHENNPTAKWFNGGDKTSTTSRARDFVRAAEKAKQIPSLVIYYVPDRDNDGASAGGARSNIDYIEWINAVSAGIGDEKAVVVLEPDALGFALKTSNNISQTKRLNLLKEAYGILNLNTNTVVYVAVSAWDKDLANIKLTADALIKMGINRVAMNVSGYDTYPVINAYLRALAKHVPNLRAIVDTSRNGVDVTEGKWCNVPEAGLGSPPSPLENDPIIDAKMYVKPPGESDGDQKGSQECGENDPPAGVISAKLLKWLIQNRIQNTLPPSERTAIPTNTPTPDNQVLGLPENVSPVVPGNLDPKKGPIDPTYSDNGNKKGGIVEVGKGGYLTFSRVTPGTNGLVFGEGVVRQIKVQVRGLAEGGNLVAYLDGSYVGDEFKPDNLLGSAEYKIQSGDSATQVVIINVPEGAISPNDNGTMHWYNRTFSLQNNGAPINIESIQFIYK
ncbi:MAG: glycoside hydrolase family 6 protein [bacterium]|nr:glycoside hydrolase family 6 protein [bacterium]